MYFSPDLLKGQAGIITGGSSGIGLGIARYLLQHGAKLTITGRDPEKLARAAEELGDGVITSTGDVRKTEDVARNLGDHLEHNGKIDFLVNNAAGNFLCRIEDMSENAFRAVMDIVVHGTFKWCKAVHGPMKDAGYGRIVNIGTTYSWAHGEWVAHSGAAKAAVLNFTRSMALEWGPQGILANVVAPGPVEGTGGMDRLHPGEKQREEFVRRTMPVPRMAHIWEIAAMVTFLISPMAAYINGAAIPVDGGACLANPGLLPFGMPVTLPSRG